jgi:hypothetical protein
LVHAR